MTPRMAEATPSSAAQFLIHVPSGLLCARYKREYTKSVRLSSSLEDLLAGLGEAVCPSGCKQQKQTVRLQHEESYWKNMVWLPDFTEKPEASARAGALGIQAAEVNRHFSRNESATWSYAQCPSARD